MKDIKLRVGQRWAAPDGTVRHITDFDGNFFTYTLTDKLLDMGVVYVRTPDDLKEYVEGSVLDKRSIIREFFSE